MSKKLINNPVDCVDEGIEGFVMTHPGLRVLGTQRVVIRDKVKYLLEIEETERERERMILIQPWSFFRMFRYSKYYKLIALSF